jgi:hypothetical protein
VLATLPACRAPADKAEILVATHKVIVDGLGRLPPLRLKSDAEIASQQTPQAAPTPTSSGFLPPKTGDAAGPVLSPVEGAPLMASPAAGSPLVPPAVLETPADDDDDDGHGPASPAGVASPAALQPRGASPLLTISPPPERAPTAVSGDVLLPLIIFAVVRAAPPRLVSQLLFVQRFRSRAAGGEAEYCLVNMMAVAEFLENVDLAALGLTGPEGQIAECVPRARVRSQLMSTCAAPWARASIRARPRSRRRPRACAGASSSRSTR